MILWMWCSLFLVALREPTQKGLTFIHFSERYILEPEWDEQCLISIAVMEGKWVNKWVSDKMPKRKTGNSVNDSGHTDLDGL